MPRTLIVIDLPAPSGLVTRQGPPAQRPAGRRPRDPGRLTRCPLTRCPPARRRRMYSLTDAGRAYAQQHADELSASWDAAAGMTDEAAVEFHDLIRQVMMAVMEVRRAGSADQLAQARAVLTQARRSLYLILAEDGGGAGPAGSEDDGPPDAEPAGPGA